MKPARILLAVLALLVALPMAQAQDATNEQNDHTADIKSKKGHETAAVSQAPAEVPLKILVVISEFAGSKRVSSLPYTLYTTTAGTAGPRRSSTASMRYGVRVPIQMGSNESVYQNVGTDIDYGAYDAGAGDYQLVFTVDRSWVGISGDETNLKAGALPGRPLLPTFRNNFTLVLRNGQTAEGASAVDPVTGHTLKVDVTLTVLK